MVMVMIITANVYIVSSAVSFTCTSFHPLNHEEDKPIPKVTQVVSEIKTQAVWLQSLHT